MVKINREEFERKAELARQLLEDIDRTINIIHEKDQIRLKSREILLDEGKIRQHMGNFRLGNIIREEYQRAKGNSRRFIANLKARSNEIRAYDGGLAGFINSIKFDYRELNLLAGLLMALRQYRDNENGLMTYFRSEAPKITGDLRSLGNNKDALKVEEIWYLIKYVQEVMNWPNLAKLQPIDFFIERLRLYFRGGMEGFKGLISDFNDDEIAEEARKRDVLKQLATYREQISFFRHLLLLIQTGVKQNDWGDFRRFWAKRKEHEKLVKERYGNTEFAEIMKKDEKAIRQQPLLWIQQIQRMHDTLDRNPLYMERVVIVPAARELIVIFENRVRELTGELEENVDDRVKELGKVTDGFSEKIIDMVKRREREFNPSKIKNDFKQKEAAIIFLIAEFFSQVEELSNKLNLEPQLKGMVRLRQLILPQSQYSLKLVSQIGMYAHNVNPSIPPRLMSALETIASVIEGEDDTIDYAMTSLNEVNIENSRDRITETYQKLQRLQNDMAEFLRNLGLGQSITSQTENIQTRRTLR